MGLPFITRKHLYVRIGCDPKNVLGCFHQINPPKQDWVAVYTFRPYLFLATPGTAQVFYNESIKIYSLHVPAGSIYASCLTHFNITQLNLTTVYIVRRQTQAWVPVDTTREWEDPNGIVALNKVLASIRVRPFVGTLIAFIVSAIVIAATAATATAALVDSVQTAQTVDVLLTNTTFEMIQQARIDQEILTRLSVVESALNWISKHQEALVTHQQLTCDPGFAKLCVTSLLWNSSQYSLSDIQHCL